MDAKNVVHLNPGPKLKIFLVNVQFNWIKKLFLFQIPELHALKFQNTAWTQN
jgi:hypothetical protein